MQDSFHRIVTGVIFFSLTIVVAVIGYALFGWELLDVLYMTIITIFGVGYGEVRLLKPPAERIFTILVILQEPTMWYYRLQSALSE